MGFFDALLGKGNPTRSWVEEESRELVLDLSKNILSCIPLGAPLEALSFLGKAQAQYFDDAWSLSYPQKGLQIDCTAQDGIESFLVHLQNMEETITNAFPGQVIFEKKSLIGGFSEDDVLNILPPPWWRHEDENEVILFYEFGAIEWQVEIPSTGLHAILICPPLLANEEQRRNYQVTRPWTFAESADTIQ